VRVDAGRRGNKVGNLHIPVAVGPLLHRKARGLELVPNVVPCAGQIGGSEHRAVADLHGQGRDMPSQDLFRLRVFAHLRLHGRGRRDGRREDRQGQKDGFPDHQGVDPSLDPPESDTVNPARNPLWRQAK